MSYRLGVDVGGTFTDLLLIDENDGTTFTAKVPSTPADPSVAVLNGIAQVCERAAIDPREVTHVLHGTTVATNAILTGSGARVGLVTTKGYRQILQIARSFVPGALTGWVLYNKSIPLAPLELTVEVPERIDARGEVVEPLDEAATRQALRRLKSRPSKRSPSPSSTRTRTGFMNSASASSPARKLPGCRYRSPPK